MTRSTCSVVAPAVARRCRHRRWVVVAVRRRCHRVAELSSLVIVDVVVAVVVSESSSLSSSIDVAVGRCRRRGRRRHCRRGPELSSSMPSCVAELSSSPTPVHRGSSTCSSLIARSTHIDRRRYPAVDGTARSAAVLGTVYAGDGCRRGSLRASAGCSAVTCSTARSPRSAPVVEPGTTTARQLGVVGVLGLVAVPADLARHAVVVGAAVGSCRSECGNAQAEHSMCRR